MSNRDKAEEAVTRVLENMVPPEADLSEDVYLRDLGFDSFSVIELAMDLEDELDLFIEDSLACKCETVGDLINFITIELEKQI